MKIFDKDREGAAELVAVIGLIGNDISFDKWEPLLPLGLRDLAAIVGIEPVKGICELYEHNDMPDAHEARMVELAQQAVAMFTWLKVIPTLDAQHGDTGRGRRLGENEKGLTALQEFKDEENIRHLAYEAVDALIEEMETARFKPWLSSRKCRLRDGLLVRSKEEFDDYYVIGSHRLFVTLLPMMREVQGATIAPVLGSWLGKLLSCSDVVVELETMRDMAARVLVLLTMQKAVERLPVEVLPEGIVQVQQSQPVKSRLKAEQEARKAVAASLAADANRYLTTLQGMVADLEGGDTATTPHITGPIDHGRGMSF